MDPRGVRNVRLNKSLSRNSHPRLNLLRATRRPCPPAPSSSCCLRHGSGRLGSKQIPQHALQQIPSPQVTAKPSRSSAANSQVIVDLPRSNAANVNPWSWDVLCIPQMGLDGAAIIATWMRSTFYMVVASIAHVTTEPSPNSAVAAFADAFLDVLHVPPLAPDRAAIAASDRKAPGQTNSIARHCSNCALRRVDVLHIPFGRLLSPLWPASPRSQQAPLQSRAASPRVIADLSRNHAANVNLGTWMCCAFLKWDGTVLQSLPPGCAARSTLLYSASPVAQQSHRQALQ